MNKVSQLESPIDSAGHVIDEELMRDRLQRRLQGLKAEFESGQRRLAIMEEETTRLRSTLLRISGAIQVLEEELSLATDAPE
ncbi:MAG: hypothetical protein JOZ17_24045 [Acetobacteraceae bacterium]|nr:hypothetical protein [Acetobacteraceae bacterium]